MSISNRELVFFLLSHKLSQRNHWLLHFRPEAAADEDKNNRVSNNGSGSNDRNGQLTPPPSPPPPPPHGLEEVKVALRQSVEEFELRYTLAFSNLSSQLPVTTATAYGSFKSVMDEVFRDDINWGRIVGLFAFGGALCVECVDKEMSHMVPRVAEWMTTYLDDHIQPWIQSHGGWVSSRQPLDRLLLLLLIHLKGSYFTTTCDITNVSLHPDVCMHACMNGSANQLL